MVTSKDVYLTKEGLQNLKEELKKLNEEKRPNLVKRVADARAMGDLMENAEYTNAREELLLVDGRIEELKTILVRVKIIREVKKRAHKLVSLGCKVTVRANGQTHVYNVVGEWEADPLNKKISHNSPLGKALLGKKVGEKVTIEAPAGKIVYEIQNIA